MTSPTAIRTQGVIRRAAMELAVEKPVDEVTVDDIAERAGVSRRTVFNHFPSKYDVYLPPVVAHSEEALETFATDISTSLADAIRTLLDARWRNFDVNLDDLRELMRISGESTELRMALKETVDCQRAALMTAAARRIGRSEDSLEVLALVGTIQAMERSVFQAAMVRPGASSAEVVGTFDRVVDVWVRLSAELAGDRVPVSTQ
ncbi:TetR/AcrR family transcriptional regulator [Cutibacterium avidum]|uniref:TetR/AcrR family transcriptional regulator n=1 Tax=Cutibacterium avidum TaxID=33010 RepID=UPI00055E45DF|nr:TetR/AcrR family transcriptional regulator [Cutibacterium avidum]MCO6633224.1 TetR family transcriptional regulator [Cutibacterium avidum]MCO6657562.1 TetR family transcriptional regulator [Cutibacterium avidum]MCO6668137.1 TetR family transcriptional regulator [Cutibacterium avidum]MCO6670385.1 TetR family transcriptional regulator [Cutibacterium avidum]MDQ9043349.1 helix-turn-helix domain-containing protein [Cutibacterium avidum]